MNTDFIFLNDYKNRCFICYDQFENKQGILVTSPLYHPSVAPLSISFLATNPDNLKSKLNPNRIRGTGSFLIKYATILGLYYRRKSIRLTSQPSAVDFYKKCGFRKKFDKMEKSLVDQQIDQIVAQSTMALKQYFPFVHIENKKAASQPIQKSHLTEHFSLTL